MNDNTIVGLMNISAGFLITILCIPLVKRKIKMNRWYGMRIPKSFKSEENWYKINEYGGKIFIYWSIPIVLIGIISLFLPPSDCVKTNFEFLFSHYSTLFDYKLGLLNHFLSVFCLFLPLFSRARRAARSKP